MGVKDVLRFLGAVAYLSCAMSDSVDDDADFTFADLKSLLGKHADLTTFRIGSTASCTSDADCSAHFGTKCYGVTGCKVCLCDPYEFGLPRSAISSLQNMYSRRSYYDTGLKKCLKPVLIDDACEHNDQCPGNGDGGRSCTNSKCVCATGYVAKTDKSGCRRSRYNEACSSNSDCYSNFKCSSDKCICDDTSKYYDLSSTPATGSDSSTACRRGYFNQACASDAECDASVGPHDNNRYLTCESNVCKCNPAYYVQNGSPSNGIAGSVACKKIEIGQMGCDTGSGDVSGVCYDGHNVNKAVCDSGTCKCKEEYPIKASDSRSCSKVPYGQTGCKTNPSSSDVEAFMDSVPADNGRCESGNLVCGTASTIMNKCVCANTHPKWNSAESQCEKLKVGDTGCITAVSGNGMVEAFTGGSAKQTERCSLNSAVCDGTGSGTCRCPAATPFLETSAEGVQNCRLIKVNENGCGARVSTNAVDYNTALDSRCFGSNTQCSTDTCTCNANNPTPNANLEDCSISRWGQSCDADADCEGALVCDTPNSKCHCDTASNWYNDEKHTVAERTGMANSNACRRINTGDTGCVNDDNLCEANRVNAGSAICDSGTCKCKTEFRLYEVNWCAKETLYGGACASGGIECISGNLTCSSDTCSCVADNFHDGTKKACRHDESSYTKAYDQTCTHDLIETTITDIGKRDISSVDRTKWQSKTSSTQENGQNTDQAVQVCGANLVCYACTSGTTTKKCLTYTAPTNPNNAGRPGIFLSVTILVALMARTLV